MKVGEGNEEEEVGRRETNDMKMVEGRRATGISKLVMWEYKIRESWTGLVLVH